MISDRYATKIADHWSPSNRIEVWLKIELLNLRQYSQEHYDKASEALKHISYSYIAEQSRLIEDKVGHEVEAFIGFLNRIYPTGLWHKGLASSDLVECSNALAVNRSTEDITAERDLLASGIRALMDKYRYVPAQAFTHGQPAEPITWGMRFLLWAEQLESPRLMPISGKITGAVGTGIVTDRNISRIVSAALNIPMAYATTQIVPRHMLGISLNELSVLAMSLEKVANDMRVLYTLGHISVDSMPVGSSSMPHKVNPYELERLIGMCKMVMSMIDCINRTNADNWLERDLVHSSVEREFLPVICNHVYYVVNKLAVILGRMHFREMDANELTTQWSSVKLADMLIHDIDRKTARDGSKNVTVSESMGYLSRLKEAIHKIL